MESKSCPVCESTFTTVIQPIYLQRQEKTTDQYRCEACESFFHISGYREDSDQLRADAEFLLAHPGDYKKFVRKVRRYFPDAVRCFEIGCGTGELLSYLERTGFEVEGVDVNSIAVSEAVRRGLNVHAGYFEKTDRKYDLIFAVDVLEHMEDPRKIVENALSMLSSEGGIAIRVPTVDRREWKYLKGAPLKRAGFDFDDPFRDNSVHITHFSTRGLFKMMDDFGFKPVGEEYKIHIFAPAFLAAGAMLERKSFFERFWLK